MMIRLYVKRAAAIALAVVGGLSVQAQLNFRYAGVADSALFIANSRNDFWEVARSARFSSLVWNADGTQLAFLMYDENFNARIGVANVDSAEVIVLDTPTLVAGYGISWTFDNLILFMGEYPAQDPLDIGADQTVAVNIMTIAPRAGATAEVVSSVRVAVGCGGGSPFLVDEVYSGETGGLGGFFLTLAQTPTSVLFSADCGGTTLAILDAASGEVLIEEGITRVVVHPSGSFAAGIEVGQFDAAGRGIRVIDLARLETSSYTASAEPQQLAWSADGMQVYYSTRVESGNALESFDEAQRAALSEAVGFELSGMPTYENAIYSLDLATGAETLVASWEGIVARMFEVDGRLYYSMIPNGQQPWLAAILAGRTTFGADAARYFTPLIVEADLAIGSQIQVGEFNQFTPLLR